MGKMKVVYLSTYPPFEDGIATFVHDMVEAQKVTFGEQTEIEVAAIDITGIEKKDYPREVKWIIPIQDKKAYKRVAEEINQDPEIAWVNIQHEYGIYGGNGGKHLVTFMRNLKKPVVITLHTMLPKPSLVIKKITQQIVDRANKIVVLTLQSKITLQKLYQVTDGKVQVVQHGIHPVIWIPPANAKIKDRLSKRLVLRTFGFLSPGKGIEFVIKALPKVVKKYPNVLYFVMGETHPLIKRTFGEEYRQKLEKLVQSLKLEKNVRFVNKYLSLPELLEALKATDIYISTSLNPDQAVSGTFSYALGAGRAVVSTKFSQALEFIDDAVGELVEIRNHRAYSGAILKLLEDDYRRERMHRRAYERTRNMLWTRVAMAYQKIYFDRSENKWWMIPEINLKHVYKMTNKIGIWQFAKRTVPDQKYGFTLDDNARAAIFCVRYLKIFKNLKVIKLLRTYIKFIEKCQQDDGMFVNYVTADGQVEAQQNLDESLDDANARAIWALGEIISANIPKDIKEIANRMWNKRMKNGWGKEYLRTRAYLIKGLAAKTEEKEEIIKQAEIIAKHYKQNSEGAWKWFEPAVTYANGVLTEAMWIAYRETGEKRYLEIAQESLEFLLEVSFKGEVFSPVGNKGWYVKGGNRADWDQQPEEVLAMVEALAQAVKINNDELYREIAARAFWWWRGNNLLGIRVVDIKNGGSHDGLLPIGVNPNEGAESTLAYLLSALVIRDLGK